MRHLCEIISLSRFIPKNLSYHSCVSQRLHSLTRSVHVHAWSRRTSVDLASDWSRGLSPHPPLTWSSPHAFFHLETSAAVLLLLLRPDTPTIFFRFFSVSSPLLLLLLLLLVPFFGRFVRAQAGIFDHPADHQQRPDHPRPRVEKKPIPRPFSSFSSISLTSSLFFFFFFFLASNRGARIGPWIISRAYSCFVRGSGHGIFRIVQSFVCLRYFAWKSNDLYDSK